MGDTELIWWKRDIGPRLASLGLAGICLVMRYRPLPMMLEWAQFDALLNMGTLIWPLVLQPWLTGLPRKRQLLWLLLGVVAGFWAMGFPLFGIQDGAPMPNIVLLPRLVGALVAGWLLVLLNDAIRGWHWAKLTKWSPSLIGLSLLWLAIHPTNVAVSLQPGELRPGELTFEVAATYELQADLVAAYTYGDVLVAVGQNEWLWRNPDGLALIRPGSFDPWRVQLYCDGQRLLIVEPVQGRVECYRYPDGQWLWTRDKLGELLDVAWTAGYAWVLNYPDFDSGVLWPFPDDPQVVLHRLNLTNGSDVQTKVQPPEHRFWKHASSGPLAWLESNQEQAWVAGWCSPDQPVYEAPNSYRYSETDLPFIFRPAQGKLRQLARLLPDGIQLNHDQSSPISYYLQGDLLVDAMLTPDADYLVRTRSLQTGKQIWGRRLGRYLSGQTYYDSYPFRADGKVLVDTGQGLLCLDENSGEEQWNFAHTSRVRWVAPVGQGDVVFGLANGLVVRVTPKGEPVWQYAASGFTDLERVEVLVGALMIRDSGITESAEWVALLGSHRGTYTSLSLADGSKLPLAETWLENDKFALAGDFVWQMRQFTYQPGPYNGDKSVYRLSGSKVTIRDVNLQQEGMLVRPDYLLVAEQAEAKTRLVMLRVAK